MNDRYARLTRRHFLGSIAAAAAVPQLFSPGQANAQPRRPNIILILADDLGYGDLGCYGQTKIRTPHIDRLAAEGTRFTQCYAGNTVCAPSRNALMTGQHTGHTTVRNNSGENAPKHDGQAGRIPLRAEDVTIAQVLKQAGYATAITGKWGLGEPGSTGLPNDHGFDEWFGYLNNDHAPDYFTDYLWRNREKQTISGNLNGKRQKYSCDLFTDFAFEYIRTHKNGPFFLYLPYTIPHKNIEAPDLGPYEDTGWPENEKTLAAMVTRLDGYVGRLVTLLKELEIDDNTLILFTSDNGSPDVSHDFFARSGPLRGKKGSMYDGGIRTPMIAHWPGTIAANTVSDALWYFPDLLSTFAEVGGVAPPDNVDGISVLPTLLGKRQVELETRFLYWESPEKDHDLAQAIRFGIWKGVRNALQKPIELYNLAEDLGEQRDVAAAHPDIIAKITTYWATARIDSPYWPIDPEKR